ncbi:MAG: helix-turn-helix domain-containing protein [Acidiferrobacteraceae bacterium]
MEQQLTFTVREASRALGVHYITLYRLLAGGAIPLRHIRIGRRIVIPHAAIEEFLAGGARRARRPGRPRKVVGGGV